MDCQEHFRAVFRGKERAVCGILLQCCGRDFCAKWEGVGLPRKPLPRRKIPADIRSLAPGHAKMCHQDACRYLPSQEAVPEGARVSAAIALLDRGWGKPPQAHAGEGGEGEIIVTIRHLVEGLPDTQKIINVNYL